MREKRYFLKQICHCLVIEYLREVFLVCFAAVVAKIVFSAMCPEALKK